MTITGAVGRRVDRRLAAAAAALLLGLHTATSSADDRRPMVSWDALGQVTGVMEKNRYVPRFPKEVAALDKREVRLEGYMMPLDVGAQQKRFLLTPAAPTCGFCLPSGPEQLVEVQARTPVKYVLDPIVLSGRFAVVHDDANGLLYRLTDATAVEKK
jgi:hypothetical protein